MAFAFSGFIPRDLFVRPDRETVKRSDSLSILHVCFGIKFSGGKRSLFFVTRKLELVRWSHPVVAL
jgi:hypothetical protein